jgi:hypothetical protein
MPSVPPSSPLLVSTVVWKISPELLIALDDRFGEPLDSYVNGSQVWLRTDGPNAETIEYRMHPVGGYERPSGMQTDQVFSNIALSVAQEENPVVPIELLWDGLEAFVAFDDEGPLAPTALADIGRVQLGLEPTAWGMVDHEGIALRWEKSGRATSIMGELLGQLHR